PLPRLRALRRVSGRGREALARGLGRNLEPALEPAAAEELDLGRCRRATDPAGPRTLRGGQARAHRSRAEVHSATHETGVRLPRSPLRLELDGPGPAADGAARAAQAKLRRLGLPT